MNTPSNKDSRFLTDNRFSAISQTVDVSVFRRRLMRCARKFGGVFAVTGLDFRHGLIGKKGLFGKSSLHSLISGKRFSRRGKARVKYAFLLSTALCLSLILSLPSKNSRAQEQAVSPQAGTYFEGDILVVYDDEKAPDDLLKHAQIRSKRAESPTGRLSNISENVALALRGQDTPEELLQRLETVQNRLNVVSQKTHAADNQTFLYTYTSQTGYDEAVDLFQDLPVKSIQPNFKYYLAVNPSDTDFRKQWGMFRIEADRAWDISQGSGSVRVAVVDSGIQRNHRDLGQNVLKSQPIAPGCTADTDSNGHGTHVAGIIGALTNNARGVAGMNWNISLLGYCVVGPTGIGSSFTISQGIHNAVDDDADVINLSLGGPILPGQDRSVESEIQRAVDNGIVVVAAAGNCGKIPPGQHPQDQQCYWGGNADKYIPGSDPNTINVASTGPNDERSAFSNKGSTIDIAAPGGNPPLSSSSCNMNASDCILSTWASVGRCPPSGSYAEYCPLAGTSMAAPHVSGLAALLIAAKPGITRAQVISAITSTADDLGTPGKDTSFGHGRINVYQAVRSVAGVASVTPSPSVSVTAPPSISPSIHTSASPTIPSCDDNKMRGDYNCSGAVDLTDFEAWRQDYERGASTLVEFEWFRKGFLDAR